MMKTKRITNKLLHFLGLMFRKLGKDTLYIFDFGKEINIVMHTWFMLETVDIILAKENGRIFEIIEGMTPFNKFKFNKKARYVIECKHGTVKKHDIQIGNSINNIGGD